MPSNRRRYKTVVTTDKRRRVMVPVPFDPDKAWGKKPQHHVTGTVNGMGVRAVVEPLEDGFGIFLGPGLAPRLRYRSRRRRLRRAAP